METITTAGEILIAQKQAAGLPLIVDTFVLALIEDQDETATIDRTRGLPDADTIVYQSPVAQSAYIDSASVVYSLFMGSDVGPFSFNTIYLVCSEDNDTVLAMATLPEVNKIANDLAQGVRGTSMTRNFVIAFEGAQALTTINIEAQAWQFDLNEATELNKGLIKLATQEEVDAGENPQHAVTPSKLATWWSAIKNQFKTAAYLEAGQLDGQVAKIGPPTVTGQTAVVVSTGSNANGRWIQFSDGSCFMQGTYLAGDSNPTTVYLPIALPSNLFNVTVLFRSHDNYGDDQASFGYLETNNTNTSFTVYKKSEGTNFNWHLIYIAEATS